MAVNALKRNQCNALRTSAWMHFTAKHFGLRWTFVVLNREHLFLQTLRVILHACAQPPGRTFGRAILSL